MSALPFSIAINMLARILNYRHQSHLTHFTASTGFYAFYRIDGNEIGIDLRRANHDPVQIICFAVFVVRRSRDGLAEVLDGMPGDKGLQQGDLLGRKAAESQSVTLFSGRAVRNFGRKISGADCFEGNLVDTEAVSVDNHVQHRKFGGFPYRAGEGPVGDALRGCPLLRLN